MKKCWILALLLTTVTAYGAERRENFEMSLFEYEKVHNLPSTPHTASTENTLIFEKINKIEVHIPSSTWNIKGKKKVPPHTAQFHYGFKGSEHITESLRKNLKITFKNGVLTLAQNHEMSWEENQFFLKLPNMSPYSHGFSKRWIPPSKRRL